MPNLLQLLTKLTVDEKRTSLGFSSDIKVTNARLLKEGASNEEQAETLAAWLSKFQPCLFGRMAAGAADLVTYCILTEDDIGLGDRHVANKIQEYRMLWHRDALRGEKSAFIILVVSQTLILAEPNKALKEFAKRLCELYLREAIQPDQLHHDRLALELPGDPGQGIDVEHFEWKVGVNVFATAADRRWWHDHRIPGGIAFSMNSVGHMARNGTLLQMAQDKSIPQPVRKRIGIADLSAALKFAMMTIANAEETISGKATWLRDLDPEAYQSLKPKCPFSPAGPLVRKDYTTYAGWYNTDYTLPSEYFLPDISRPSDIRSKELDFTYLFDDSIDNPDHEMMGRGRRTY